MEVLNPKQELFCQFYVMNDELFGNATLSYAEAYDYKLDTLSKERPILSTDDLGNPKEYGESEYDLAYNVCAVTSSRSLRSAKVQLRVRELLNELLKDDVVDSELAKVIRQNHKLESKMAAIREYNKLKGRIIDKTDLTSKGEQILISDPKAAAITKKYEDELKGTL